MNIIILTHSGRVVTRPDTSWEKDSRDIYLPDFVKALSLSPVLFVKITKPGRSISERFATRYYDSYGFGCLLYAENLIDSHPEAYASACCLDHSSILPAQMAPCAQLEQEQIFSIELDGAQFMNCCGISIDRLNQAVALATSHCSVRHGDLIAIELDTRKELPAKTDSSYNLKCFHQEIQSTNLTIFF